MGSGKSSGITSLKVVLGIFTAVLWIVGAAFLAGGIYSKIKLGSYDLLSAVNIAKAPYVLIGIGAVILVIGIFGCCAIGQENSLMLRIYAITLGLLFLAEIALAIVVVVYRTKILSSFNNGMIVAMKNYQKTAEYKTVVDKVQNTLKCCGVYNATDYWTAANWKKYTLPESCCANHTLCKPHTKNGILSFLNESTSTEATYDVGCPMKVYSGVTGHYGIALGVVFAVAFFQLIGIVIACCISSSISDTKYEAV